jgi:hypothetical protein
MEMRSWLWTSLLAFGLTVGRVFAQDAVRPAPSASDVRVVRVRVVHTVGMCGGYGHCTAMTTVSPSFIIRESKDSGDKQKFPDRRTKRAITKQDWESLLRAIDKESLKAIPQPTGCPSCIDLPDTWLEVNLSDGTHISVSFAPENPPVPVATLLREIGTIDAKSKPR